MTDEKKIVVGEVSEEDAAAALGEKPQEELVEAEEAEEEEGAPKPMSFDEKLAGPRIEGLPEFASLPPGFVIPPGKRCGWMLFRAAWTDAPEKGDRWCMMWPLSEAEEKNAYKRTAGEGHRSIAELTKASIRIIDGVKADRTGPMSVGSVNMFWAQMGVKCRQLMMNYYLKTHTLSPEEQQDFFGSCFVVSTAVGG